MAPGTDPSRVLVRLSRPNRRALNSDALDELLNEEFLTHDPACVEAVVEIDETAVELLEERNDYRVDVLSST